MADANHIRMFGGNEPENGTTITKMHSHWQAYGAWLTSPAFDAMDDDEFALHVEVLTSLERGILRAPATTVQDLAAQIEVLTANWKETAYLDDLRKLVTCTHSDQEVAA